MRSHSQTLDVIKAFIERWKGRGYEKGESQAFWIDLLQNVLEVENPVEIISFENQVKLESTSFIDAYIAPTKVLIEQKSIDKNLRKAVKQSDGALLSPYQQAKRYASELPMSKHPRWVVTCNFKSFLIYDMENPHVETQEILLEDLEKDYYRLRFLVEDGKAHLKRELEISTKAGELVGKLYDAFLKQYEDAPGYACVSPAKDSARGALGYAGVSPAKDSARGALGYACVSPAKDAARGALGYACVSPAKDVARGALGYACVSPAKDAARGAPGYACVSPAKDAARGAPGYAGVSPAKDAARGALGYAGVSPAKDSARGGIGDAGVSPAKQNTNTAWHSRGYLPHCEAEKLQSITFRLCDSVPKDVIIKWKEECKHASKIDNTAKEVQMRKLIEQYEDAGLGECYLKDDRIAELVQNALLHFDGERYKLLRWCIMPNHVHVLVKLDDSYSLSDIMHSWRSYTSHEANKILNRTGQFWMEEYFDRYIRDEKHLNNVIEYIDNNPVKAGLVENSEDFKWCSARAGRPLSQV